MIMSEKSDENKRYDELSKRLEEELAKGPKKVMDTFDTNIRKMKLQGIEQMDKAIKEGDLISALYYQQQVRLCKMMLREL